MTNNVVMVMIWRPLGDGVPKLHARTLRMRNRMAMAITPRVMRLKLALSSVVIFAEMTRRLPWSSMVSICVSESIG